MLRLLSLPIGFQPTINFLGIWFSEKADAVLKILYRLVFNRLEYEPCFH